MLALMALAPIVSSTTFTKATYYPAGIWRVAFLTLGNQPAPKGIGTVFLYNITRNPTLVPPVDHDVLISWATIGDNGIATFIDLPGDVWDHGAGGNLMRYRIQVNYTLLDGTVTKIMLLNYTVTTLASAATPLIFVGGLGKMLNDTAGMFQWDDLVGAGVWTRPGYYLALVPQAFRPTDEANFSLPQASGEMWAKVWTNTAHTTNTQYSLYSDFVNGTFNSEFLTGIMPFATINYNVGWINFLVPCNFSTNPAGPNVGTTGLANLTFIFRYKTNDADYGPIVGRFNVSSIVIVTSHTPIAPLTLPAIFELPGGVPAANTIPKNGPMEGHTIHAYIGDEDVQLLAGANYKNTAVNVRWLYWNLTDEAGNPWWTMEAEKSLKWQEGPIGAYQYTGTNVAPGRILQRYPARLEKYGTMGVTLSGFGGQFTFHLDAGVFWTKKLNLLVGYKTGYNPNGFARTMAGLDATYHYGFKKIGTSNLTSDFGHMADKAWTTAGGCNVSSKIETTNMTFVTGIQLVSKAEVPQSVGNQVVVHIMISGGMAIPTELVTGTWWLTNTTGFVQLPDTDALRENSDLYGLLAGTTYSAHINEHNYGGWLPLSSWYDVNFRAWFDEGIVLDTTVPGGFLPGNLPLVLTANNYGKQWNYSLAIYEMGFVLKFTPAPNGDVRPVPWYTPFMFNGPRGLWGPSVTIPAINNSQDYESYGLYEFVKAAGTYKDFCIVWKGSLIYALNATTLTAQGPITLDENMPNIELIFPVYDLNVTVWSQDPFKIVNVDVRLRAETDFSTFGLPYFVIRQITDPAKVFARAVLPQGATYFVEPGGAPVTDHTGFAVQSTTLVGDSLKWVYWSEFETTGQNIAGQVLPARFEKLPKKVYDIWVRVPDDTVLAISAGFRSVDENRTLYWSKDPYSGAPDFGPVNLTAHYSLDLKSYVYNPNVSIKDAGGAPLELSVGSNSAIFLVEPWYNSTYQDFWEDKFAGTWNPYFIRVNSTNPQGEYTFHSVNATQVSPVPIDPELHMLGTDPGTVGVADKYEIESRYLIGKSTFQSAPPYRFMVYYKGVLVFNESIPLQNPFVSKDHDIVTSVYPYVFKVTNYPLAGETWRFGIQNLDVKVFWAGLNLTYWPSFSLTMENAVKEFSLLNASKLEKGFNMSIVSRLWHWIPGGPITLLEIPYQPVPPYFSAALFVESGVTDVDGEFKVWVPVWNYSYSNMTYTYLVEDIAAHPTWGALVAGGPKCPWYKPSGPLGINLETWGVSAKEGGWGVHGTDNMSGYFGTPVYANWTTKPGTTNNIPADDIVRLAATLKPAWLALNQSWNWKYVYSVNATGLVNTQSYYAQTTGPAISLNTTSRAPAQPWGGVGILSGGVFQGRQKVNVFEKDPPYVVGPASAGSYANFYAKLQVNTTANDIGVLVLDSPDFSGGGHLGIGNDLPNQYVEVWNYGDYPVVDIDALMFKGYTPLDSPSILYVRSTPTNILWGFYNFAVATTNLTQVPTHDLQKDWELDPQWLVASLPGGSIDWWSYGVTLQWPTKLQVTVYAGDAARYLHNAWVFIVDAVTNDNITAALTDDAGYPNSIDITGPALITAWQYDPLATGNPSGSRLNLGFNLGYAAWSYIEAAPFGDIIVNCTSGSGKWIVKVFWKAPDAGVVQTFGKIDGVSVWDTFRDQPQHRYIYLGVDMPVNTGEDNATCQVRTFNTKVYDLKLKVVDQSPSARLAPDGTSLKITGYGWTITNTTNAGEFTLKLVPAGGYNVVATYPTSLYGKSPSTFKAAVVANVIDGPATVLVQLPIFDATVTLVTPSGRPIVGATVTVVGGTGQTTDAAGNVLFTSIPSGSYSVTATWYVQPINPTQSLAVTLSRTYLLTASNIALVAVQVIGAQNQGLSGANVVVKTGTTTVFNGMASSDGTVALELPYGNYNFHATYKSVTGDANNGQPVAINADTVVTIPTGVFIELFGQGLSFAGFALWVVAVLIVVLILVIAAQEYNIYRRKRLPQLFGAGPTR